MNSLLEIPQNLIHGTIKDDTRYRHFSSFSAIGISKNTLNLSLNRAMDLNKGDVIRIKIQGVILDVEVLNFDKRKQHLVILIEFTG